MALTYAEGGALGAEAPAFALPDANPLTASATFSLADASDVSAVVVVFTCNHCPYAKHVEEALVALAHDYAEQGVQLVAINSNDAEAYPADGPKAMAQRAEDRGFPFPYLYDESQAVARAYGAVCTPDPFVLNGDHRIVYRGQVDGSRPGQGTADARTLRAVLDELLATGAVTAAQKPSVGCSIKWKQDADA